MRTPPSSRVRSAHAHRALRPIAGGLAVLASLALCGTAAAVQPVACTSKAAAPGHACSEASGPLRVTIVPSTHHPKINAKWPLEVSAAMNGKPVTAGAFYEFLFGFAVVSTQYVHYNKHFMFHGRFTDTLVFPPASQGQALKLRVVVKAAGRTVNLDWAITPVKK